MLLLYQIILNLLFFILVMKPSTSILANSPITFTNVTGLKSGILNNYKKVAIVASGVAVTASIGVAAFYAYKVRILLGTTTI